MPQYRTVLGFQACHLGVEFYDKPEACMREHQVAKHETAPLDKRVDF